MNTATAAAAAQTDASLWTLLTVYGGRAVRDNEGNLRGLTDEEVAFGKAIRAEATRRGLV